MLVKKHKLKTILFLAISAFLTFAGINAYVKYTSNQLCFINDAKLPDCDVGIIFGAGLRNNGPGKYLKDRLDAGIKLYKKNRIQKLLLSGDNGNTSHDEIIVMKEYCYENGVDTTKIFVDYAGFDTYSTLYRAKHIFKVNKAILISQNYHLDRAVFLGNRLGIRSYGFIANKGSYRGYRKNSIREYFAIIKSTLDLIVHRKPKFMGKIIDINGPSNYTK
jgi:SanA protein